MLLRDDDDGNVDLGDDGGKNEDYVNREDDKQQSLYHSTPSAAFKGLQVQRAFVVMNVRGKRTGAIPAEDQGQDRQSSATLTN